MKKYFRRLILFFASGILFSAHTDAQAGLQITLRVDYEMQKKIFRDEPLVFSVTFQNKAAQAGQLWNISAERRINAIDEMVKNGTMQEEEGRAEKEELEKNKKAVQATFVGDAANPWYAMLKWNVKLNGSALQTPLPLVLLVNPAADATAILDEAKTASAYFGISPEAMQSFQAGKYSITVEWNNTISNEVYVEVMNEKMTPEIAGHHDKLLKAGQYFWHAGDGKRTLEYANKILQKNPASLDGLSLKGDAQYMLEYYLPALETYNLAVKEYYRQFGGMAEPPEYLLSMIGIVREKLGDVKN